MSTGRKWHGFMKDYHTKEKELEKKYGKFGPKQYDYKDEPVPRSTKAGKSSALKDYRATRSYAHTHKKAKKNSKG